MSILFVKHRIEWNIFIVSLYVDDLIYTGNGIQMMDKFIQSMKGEFFITYLGMRYFLRIEVKKGNDGIFIYQHNYAAKILSSFGMEGCKKVCSHIVPSYKLVKDDGEAFDATIFKQMVGSLIYLLATILNMIFFVLGGQIHRNTYKNACCCNKKNHEVPARHLRFWHPIQA